MESGGRIWLGILRFLPGEWVRGVCGAVEL